MIESKGQVIVLTDAGFETTLSQHDFVIVDFWAPWCRPCLAFSEVYGRVAFKSQDVLFTKVNVDEEVTLAQDFGVRSIPFLLIVRHQIVVYGEPGSMSEPELMTALAQARELSMDEVTGKAQPLARGLRFIGAIKE